MKKVLIFVMVLLGVWGATGVLAPTEMQAEVIRESRAADCDKGMLGLRPWYMGLTTKKGGRCEIGTPKEGEEGMAAFVWTIILNVLVDLFTIGGLAAIVFVVYGGYQYIRSSGDPSKMEKGKKTLIAAVSGLVVMLLATIISSTITTLLTEATK